MQIEDLQRQFRLCVVSKPPKIPQQFSGKPLGEITEEDEEKAEEPQKTKTPTIELITSEDPERRFQVCRSYLSSQLFVIFMYD